VIRNRLNRPSQGTIVIVAHRLQENDLCGHVLEDGDDWTKIVLPFEATRLAVFDLGHGKKWRRKKGELLRTGEFSERVRKRLRTLRNFQALYQQNPGGSALPKISAKHFPLQPLVDNERSRPLSVSIRVKPKVSATATAWCKCGASVRLDTFWWISGAVVTATASCAQLAKA
jgi:hypothetical protein